MSSIFREIPYNIGMEIFRERLKYLRKNAELTQKELADILQTNNSSVCDWECGRSQPDLETLKRMAKFFLVTTDYLLGLENDDGSKPYLSVYDISK